MTAEISHFLSNDRGCRGGLALKPSTASRTSTSSSEPRQVRSAGMALPFPHAQAAFAHAQRRVFLQSRCRYRVAGSFSTGQEVLCVTCSEPDHEPGLHGCVVGLLRVMAYCYSAHEAVVWSVPGASVMQLVCRTGPCMAFRATNRTVVASDVKLVLRDVAWRLVPSLRRTLPCLYRESPRAITFAKKKPQQPNVLGSPST